jgi:hydroxymethylglutaryl-CoA lyase
VVPIARQWDIQLRGAVATAFGCPFEGEVSLDNILKIVGSYDAHGIRNITFGDTTGMATPPVVTRVVDAVRNKYPDMEIALHFHNTRGVGLANVMNGLQLGVREFESSIADLRRARQEISVPRTWSICSKSVGTRPESIWKNSSALPSRLNR